MYAASLCRGWRSTCSHPLRSFVGTRDQHISDQSPASSVPFGVSVVVVARVPMLMVAADLHECLEGRRMTTSGKSKLIGSGRAVF